MGANDFTTKDSGERAVFESGMQRDTQAGKPRFDLMFPLNVPYDEQMIVRLAALYGRGAEKYDERNWEQANSEEEMARMKASAFRHFMQWFCGESDEDHAAGAMFNIIAFETTSFKVDRAIDGLQPHEVEAVTQIVEDVRSGAASPTAVVATDMSRDYGEDSSEPAKPDGTDCEPVGTAPACEWGVAYFSCPVKTSEGCVPRNHREYA